jgi:hypothetical protein
MRKPGGNESKFTAKSQNKVSNLHFSAKRYGGPGRFLNRLFFCQSKSCFPSMAADKKMYAGALL